MDQTWFLIFNKLKIWKYISKASSFLGGGEVSLGLVCPRSHNSVSQEHLYALFKCKLVGWKASLFKNGEKIQNFRNLQMKFLFEGNFVTCFERFFGSGWLLQFRRSYFVANLTKCNLSRWWTLTEQGSFPEIRGWRHSATKVREILAIM